MSVPDENLLREAPPRSDATVELYAQPVNDMERRGWRMVRRYLFALLALEGLLLIVHAPTPFIVGVLVVGSIYPALVVLLRKQAGHADDLVRGGRAYTARAERVTGRGLGGSMNLYRYRWTDAGGREQTVEFPAPKRDAPAQTSEAIVLDNGNRRVVGVIVAGRMFVPARK